MSPMLARPLLCATLVLAAAALAGCTGNEPDRSLQVELSAGGSYNLTASADERVSRAVASFRVENVGDGSAEVRVILTDPTGLVVAFRDVTLAPGATGEAQATRGYAGSGPSGTFTAGVEVLSGSVRLTEGGIAFTFA